ncbi:MAG: ATP-grasp domain-containing protein [Chloroflexi bacterium]|nr:ATP-grasp domain-containing protein [Chloroflexota bacterium]
MRRVLLLLPTRAYRASDFLEAARELGVEVVVGAEQRHALDDVMASRVIELPLNRPEIAADAIVEFADEAPLNAIVPVDDAGVAAASLAAERLGLAHSPPAATALTRDKAAMRRRLAQAGVPQPAFALVDGDEDSVAAAAELGLQVVPKPLTLSATRGVDRRDPPPRAASAAARIRRMLGGSDDGLPAPLLVERFAPGVEVAVEGLLRRGTLHTLAIFDKPDPLDGPYFEETLYITPSRLPGEVQRAVEEVTSAAVVGLGLTEGPVHAEIRVDGDAATVIEVAARSIGGLCARSLRFGLGVSLESLILRHALNLPLRDTTAAHAGSGVMMLPIPRAGVLVEVRGREAALDLPGIVGLEITIAPGGWVEPLPEGDRYLGFMFARGDTPDAVESALRRAHAKLEVEIDPDRAPRRRGTEASEAGR